MIEGCIEEVTALDLTCPEKGPVRRSALLGLRDDDSLCNSLGVRSHRAGSGKHARAHRLIASAALIVRRAQDWHGVHAGAEFAVDRQSVVSCLAGYSLFEG
jgi:hypothetical protein